VFERADKLLIRARKLLSVSIPRLLAQGGLLSARDEGLSLVAILHHPVLARQLVLAAEVRLNQLAVGHVVKRGIFSHAVAVGPTQQLVSVEAVLVTVVEVLPNQIANRHVSLLLKLGQQFPRQLGLGVVAVVAIWYRASIFIL